MLSQEFIFRTFIPAMCSLIFSILFLQSGLDKVFDWKNNFIFHTEHFAKSPLKNFTMPMLFVITVLEISCGLLCLYGCVQIFINGDARVALTGEALAIIIFIFLFLGQRIAKDYEGAATIIIYFILALLAIIFTDIKNPGVNGNGYFLYSFPKGTHSSTTLLT